MKVKYIGAESVIGSRSTLAFGRTWHIGEVVDMASLDEKYVAQFGAKIAKHPAFEVMEDRAQKAEVEVAVVEGKADDTRPRDALSEADAAPAKAPRKKKST